MLKKLGTLKRPVHVQNHARDVALRLRFMAGTYLPAFCFREGSRFHERGEFEAR